MSDSLATPWTVAHQAPLSMGFLKQESWSGLPFPSPGDLPNPGLKPMSPALAGRFFTTESPGKPLFKITELKVTASFLYFHTHFCFSPAIEWKCDLQQQKITSGDVFKFHSRAVYNIPCHISQYMPASDTQTLCSHEACCVLLGICSWSSVFSTLQSQ